MNVLMVFCLVSNCVKLNVFGLLAIVMSFLFYRAHELDHLHRLNQFVYFVVFNVVLFAISVSLHQGLAQQSGYLLVWLGLNMLVAFVGSRQEKLFKSWIPIILYPLSYIGFAVAQTLPMDLIYIISIPVFVHCHMKSHTILFPKKDTNSMAVWQYAVLNDFDKGLSFHKYGIPITQGVGETRLIDDEIKLMRSYNKALDFKNKIMEKNFGEIGNLYFYVPKSLSLVMYQTIIAYCDKNSTSNNAISIKVRDYTDQPFNANRGDYMLEFRIDQELLKNHNHVDGMADTLPDAIAELQNICIHKKIGIYGIEHGVNVDDKRFYLIRIKYQKTENIAPKVAAALNQLNNSVERLNIAAVVPVGQTEYEKFN